MAQQSFSLSHKPTVWQTIPVLEFLQQSGENMAVHLKFSGLENAIYTGLKNLQKWYWKANDTDVYLICLTFDPNWKLTYTEEKWDPEFFQAGHLRLESIFNTYTAQMQVLNWNYHITDCGFII